MRSRLPVCVSDITDITIWFPAYNARHPVKISIKRVEHIRARLLHRGDYKGITETQIRTRTRAPICTKGPQHRSAVVHAKVAKANKSCKKGTYLVSGKVVEQGRGKHIDGICNHSAGRCNSKRPILNLLKQGRGSRLLTGDNPDKQANNDISIDKWDSQGHGASP